MQQATVNLFSDMGVLPGTRQTNLITPTPSSDATAPTVQISSPGNGSNVASNTVITIAGSATDVGGEVGGVELSFDNGQTWKPANGAVNWSYSYTTPSSGSVTIMARAFDDSWNTGAAVSTTINVTTSNSPGCPCSSLFGNTIPPNTTVFNDGTPLVLGMRFRSDVQGNVNGVRFYKGTNNTGTHTGMLYTNTGTLLAQVNFTNETASGWQEAIFSTPVSIQAGVSYVIAYFSGSGNYSATNFDFTSAKSNPPITGWQTELMARTEYTGIPQHLHSLLPEMHPPIIGSMYCLKPVRPLLTSLHRSLRMLLQHRNQWNGNNHVDNR